MFDRLRLGMASRLLLAFAALILPLAAFAAWSYQQSLEERRENVLQDQLQLTRTAGAVISGQLRDFDTTLLASAHGLAAQSRVLDQSSVGPMLEALAQRYAWVQSIFFIGPDGTIEATATGESVGTDLTAHPYVRALAGGADFVLADSTAAEDGRQLVVVARAVRPVDGGYRGIIAIAFYPERLSELFPGTLPEQTRLVVVDRGGTLLVSSGTGARPASTIGLADVPIVRTALAGGVGSTTEFLSPLDGEYHLGAAVPVGDYGWAVMTTRSSDSVEAPLNDRFRRDLLVLGLVMLAALLLGWVLSRALVLPLARLARRAHAFGRGESTEPIEVGGPPEVRALAEALNTMSREVQARFNEREAALEEAKLALDVRDQFVSVAAHELRTPLTALKGHVQIARRRLAGGVAATDLEPLLRRAETQVDRLTGLVSDLLDVARISSGGFVIEPEPVAPAPLIRRVAEIEQALAPGRRIELDLPQRLPVIDADPPRLEQVLINLVENALKYSPPDKPVRIAAEVVEDRLEIVVQDQGPGIPAEEQEYIFERFHRASNVDRNISGLGLGLYISWEIVQAHGGDLTVDSEPGQGSAFCIALPIEAVEAEEEHDEDPVRMES
ncbi:MAG: ATP-binding protein [Dehalococcoidia bacterium]